MKDSYSYEDRASYANINVQWLFELEDQNVRVTCDDESRMYVIPEPVTEMKTEDEYVFIYVEGGDFYQFKFEFDMFLAGDKFDKNDEHICVFACHTFGEDL